MQSPSGVTMATIVASRSRAACACRLVGAAGAGGGSGDRDHNTGCGLAGGSFWISRLIAAMSASLRAIAALISPTLST